MKIIHKTVNHRGHAQEYPLLIASDGEGILQKTLAAATGLQDAPLSVLIVRHQLARRPLTTEEAAIIREAGVMPTRAPRGNFVPRQTVEALARITESERIRNFYLQAWPGQGHEEQRG